VFHSASLVIWMEHLRTAHLTDACVQTVLHGQLQEDELEDPRKLVMTWLHRLLLCIRSQIKRTE
jgi:hypothetical protein